MKIKRISVTNLFGIFNHEIPLNDSAITIIHGPNGFGKTALLRLINGFFSGRDLPLRQTPFSEFTLEFDNNSILRIKKNPRTEAPDGIKPPNERSTEGIVFEYSRPRAKTQHYSPRGLGQNDLQFPIHFIEREIPELERIGPGLWLHSPTREQFTLDEIADKFGDRLPFRSLSRRTPEPEWLKTIRSSIPVRFIETQRLLNFTSGRKSRDSDHRSAITPSVLNYSEELASAIQSKLAEYATLSQSMDRTFPTRLVNVGSTETKLSIAELKTRLGQLEAKRSRLMDLGLLDKEKEIDFQQLQRIDENNRNVLSVYIDDVEKKLSVLDELTNKIDLLVKIIGSRFLYKKMSISKKDGFQFETSNGRGLPPTSLSSGEQHELVLLYELLFRVGRDSLILIDEPELSLHISWQQQFLNDLEDISKLTGLVFLVATHSPQIIHDRMDLAVSLVGPATQ